MASAGEFGPERSCEQAILRRTRPSGAVAPASVRVKPSDLPKSSSAAPSTAPGTGPDKDRSHPEVSSSRTSSAPLTLPADAHSGAASRHSPKTRSRTRQRVIQWNWIGSDFKLPPVATFCGQALVETRSRLSQCSNLVELRWCSQNQRQSLSNCDDIRKRKSMDFDFEVCARLMPNADARSIRCGVAGPASCAARELRASLPVRRRGTGAVEAGRPRLAVSRFVRLGSPWPNERLLREALMPPFPLLNCEISGKASCR